MKRTNFLTRLIGIILFFLIILLLIFISSPRPTAFLIRKLFEGGIAVEPDGYELIRSRVDYLEDIAYESSYPSAYLDLALPRNHGKLPVVFWLHGGAYVGGDKEDVKEYAVQIADRGYGVVNINYDLAPESKYPTPIIQLTEAYTFIKKEAKNYGLDLDRVYFAGDSAGAQIVSQFINIQTDISYSEKMGIEALVETESIKGGLLFCGLYDISKLKAGSDSRILDFIIDRIGWSYMGNRNWKESEEAYLASIKDHISASYPPVFITDGNIASFQDQAEDLALYMDSLGIDVTSIFYDEDSELFHEYQFMMDLEESRNTFEEMIKFLEKNKINKE